MTKTCKEMLAFNKSQKKKPTCSIVLRICDLGFTVVCQAFETRKFHLLAQNEYNT